jgi:ribosome-associated heat shock protein Hsp15
MAPTLMPPDTRSDAAESMRLDKWLWVARLFKTRSLAAAAVERGQVRGSGNRLKPAHTVRAGDRLTARRGDETLELTVLGLSPARGAAAVARTLYAESLESLAARAQARESSRLMREPAAALKGRPSKRDARALRRLAQMPDIQCG